MREIELKPSRRLGLLLLGMTALALVAVALAALPAAARLAVGAGVIALAALGWRRARFSGVLRVTGDGRLQCPDAEGAWVDLEVLGDSLVTPALVVLRYRMPAERAVRSLVLLSDSADADALRRLRVSLRWTRRTRSDTPSPDAG